VPLGENSSCDISRCNLRHPKKCKFYSNYKRCKFDPCAFLHIDSSEISNSEIFKKLDDLAKLISEKDLKIKRLEERLEILENILPENAVENVSGALEKEEESQPQTNVIENNQILKCSKCDFEAKSDRGLKIHEKRKCAKLETNKFPKTCEICEKEILSLKDMRKQLKTHSYFGNYHERCEDNFKCLDCDFTSQTI
jgi:hypothetical protein